MANSRKLQPRHVAPPRGRTNTPGLAADTALALFQRGNLLRSQGRLDQAAASFLEAIAENANFAEAHNNLANILRLQGQTEAAIAAYRRAIACKPRFSEAHANLAVILQEHGAIEQACVELEAALAVAPYRGSFHRMLVNTGRVIPGAEPYRRLEKLESRLAAMAQDDRMELHFAMGAAFAAAGEIPRATRHFIAANRLRRQTVSYDEAAVLGVFPRLKNAFAASIFLRARPPAPGNRTPIFIVGMPRSGTTLVEQILGSHPNVHAAGELPDLPRLTRQLAQQAGSFPECIPAVSADNFGRLGAAYRRGLHARSSATSTHVVDKLPANFQLAGLIALALPDARIVHIQRDPVDTCLSCFAELFTDDVSYSYDLGELGRYFRAYRDLMAHWRAVLPPGRMLELRYEDLVTDLPAQAARLLDHCALPWNDGVLRFHESRRDVRTASAAQVRRPIYMTSKGKWHRFAELSEQLRRAIEE